MLKFHDAFEKEFDKFDEKIKKSLLSHAELLAYFGPSLGRPRVDTLKGSEHSNLKELRFSMNKGVWRVIFAYDPKREAILLVAGNKSGVNEKRFYQEMIEIADQRYSEHLALITAEES